MLRSVSFIAEKATKKATTSAYETGEARSLRSCRRPWGSFFDELFKTKENSDLWGLPYMIFPEKEGGGGGQEMHQIC